MNAIKKYKNTIVFSGGGFRVGMYLGMFAAANDAGIKPDLIIASCGGSLSTAIINSFKTDTERKNFLLSEKVYTFFKSMSLTKEKMLYRIGIDSLIRQLRKKNASHIIDLFTKYIVDIPDFNNFFPEISNSFNNSINVMIIGSKILYSKDDVGLKRGNRKLFKEIIITDPQTKKLLEGIDSKIGVNHRDSAIHKEIGIYTDIPVKKAVRISIADMFYFSPYQLNSEYYMGGAVNLMPIEIANRVSNSVIFEFKQEYKPKIEESALRNVFGYSGIDRMKAIHDMHSDHWIDTTDAPVKLKNRYISTKINYKKLCVDLTLPESYEKFRSDMLFQWDYGYKRATESFSFKEKNYKNHIRNVNRYNTSEGLIYKINKTRESI
ncbi:MAG: patatin-like phospholipase family protein [Desulfobacterales bacterium]|nr:patatin-like phospholipase family protein [Desulfobacterales bacterium]